MTAEADRRGLRAGPVIIAILLLAIAATAGIVGPGMCAAARRDPPPSAPAPGPAETGR